AREYDPGTLMMATEVAAQARHWFAQLGLVADKQGVPFPFARRIPVWLQPTADGKIEPQVIGSPAELGDTFKQAVQRRLAAGPVLGSGEFLEVELPAFKA